MHEQILGHHVGVQVLAEEGYGGRESLIRVDMSELMERHSVTKLIGAPPGNPPPPLPPGSGAYSPLLPQLSQGVSSIKA